MKKLAAIAVTVAILGAAFLLTSKRQYVPVVRDRQSPDQGLVERPDLLTSSHINHVKALLDGYGYDCKIIDGALYIPRSLAADKDLLANMTEKTLGVEEAEVRGGQARSLAPPSGTNTSSPSGSIGG